jgi:Megaviricetes DNA primase
MSQLQNFLDQYRVKKGEPYTHTSMGHPAGAYFIPDDQIEKVCGLVYQQVFIKKIPCYLTEKPPQETMIKIDIDLRYDLTDTHRKYSESQIVNIVTDYVTAILCYLDVPNENKGCCVFERSKPYQANGNTKDGVHLMFPAIICDTKIQHLIRDRYLTNAQIQLKQMGSKNAPDDIIDKAIISTNNWLMYGCSKPNIAPYKFSYNIDSEFNVVRKDIKGIELDFIKFLSIRLKNKPVLTIRSELAGELAPLTEQVKSKVSKVAKICSTELSPEQLLWVDKFVKSKYYHSSYKIIEAELGGLIRFQGSEKYNCKVCHEEHTNNNSRPILYQNKNKTISFCCRPGNVVNLGHVACLLDDNVIDNAITAMTEIPKSVFKITALKTDEQIKANFIKEGLSGTEEDLARLLAHLHKHDHAYVTRGSWYRYKNHRWEELNEGLQLRELIQTEISPIYVARERKLKAEIAELNAQLIACSPDDKEQIDLIQCSRKQRSIDLAQVSIVVLKLKTTKLMSCIMTETSKYMLRPKFEDKLDSNPNLIGFENGIYDLTIGALRDGLPSDYVTLSTGYDYVFHAETEPHMIELRECVKKIYQISETDAKLTEGTTTTTKLDFVIRLLSTFVDGMPHQQLFTIMLGLGGNGKSVMNELLAKAFGKYCKKGSIKVITDTKNNSTACYETAQYRGIRALLFSEPNKDAKPDIGIIKDWTGGEDITGRMIYKMPFTFKPQFHILYASNHDPELPRDDGGIWRRSLLLDHPAQFVPIPNPDNPYEYQADLEIATKINVWGSYFMSLLLEEYKLYKADGYKLDIPTIIRNDLEQFKNNQDDSHASNFLAETITKDATGYVTLNEIWNRYKASTIWSETDKHKRFKKKDLRQAVCLFDNGKYQCRAEATIDGTKYHGIFMGLRLLATLDAVPYALA